jgi:type IV pilus assembly protein PilO
MALQDSLQQLKNFDMADLDVNNIGNWPGAVKGIILALLVVLIGVLGYVLFITEKRDRLRAEASTEKELRTDYEAKAFQAANLEELRAQRDELEKTFGELVSQLPSDTEVPGLIEDITDTAIASGLAIESIVLEEERTAEYYIELPITIKVAGSYHDLGSFVSGVSNLSRIVTLHDFTIGGKDGADKLAMTILAKTYRYHDEGGAAAAPAAAGAGA